MSVLTEIQEERARQDWKWGGIHHDIDHHENDWNRLILTHLSRAHGAELLPGCDAHGMPIIEDVVIQLSIEAMVRQCSYKAPGRSTALYRKQMIRVAALATAAVEAVDARTQTEVA